jgi:signal transduction histidine kinase
MKNTMRIALRKSSSFTLALIFMAVLGFCILTLLHFMNLASKDSQRRNIHAVIQMDMQGLVDAHHTTGLEGLSDILEYRLKHPQLSRMYALINDHNEVIMGNFSYLPKTPLSDDPFITIDLPEATANTGLPDHKHYTISAMRKKLDGDYILMVGRNIPDVEVHQQFSDRLGWGMIALLALIALAAFYIGDRVVYRINVIADTATHIMATGDLSRRIPLPGKWDDLSVLAHILNTLFNRIEALMESVRQVSDNIAHDLRTPLTRMRNHIENLCEHNEKQQLGIEPYTEHLLNEIDHMLATFAALLRIANVESGKWKVAGETVALDALITDVVELYEPLTTDNHQHIHTQLAPVTLQGDKHLLFQAVANLVDNAMKYAPNAADIHISLEQKGGEIILHIINSGSNVAPDALEKIFQRFYRTDAARHDEKTGNGLGLSLVKAIIELHRGTVTASNTTQGFCITCRFVCAALPT